MACCACYFHLNTFIDLKLKVDKNYQNTQNFCFFQLLQMVFDRVKYLKKGTELKALAERGIGYHHRCLFAKEKQLVEILFRKGFIRVSKYFHSNI